MQLSDQIKQIYSLRQAYSDYGVNVPSIKGKGVKIHCPFPGHNDSNASFTVWAEGNNFSCFSCSVCPEGSVIDFIMGMEGIGEREAIKRLAAKVLPNEVKTEKSAFDWKTAKKIREHFYQDELGNEIIRKEIHKDATGEKIAIPYNIAGVDRAKGTKGLNGLKYPVYQLPLIIKAIVDDKTIFLVEGCKDAESLCRLALSSTTVGGATSRWMPQHLTIFPKGHNVVILIDNDEAGKKYGNDTANTFVKHGCNVKLINLADHEPRMGNKADVTDWLMLGNKIDQLIKLVASTDPWELSNVYDIDSKQQRAKETKIRDDWFNDEGNFVPPPLAEKILTDNDLLYDRQDLLLYGDGVYHPNGRHFIKKITQNILGDAYRDSRGIEVVKYLETKLYQADPILDRNPNILNVANGVIDMQDWRDTGVLTLHPHSPKYLSSIRVPVIYNPNADCPAIRKFLSEVLPPDCQDLILEIIGHLLFPDFRFQKAFMLTGAGANGKSVLLDLIGNFIGHKNSSSVSLQDLSDNRFRAAELTGKLINICPDISSKLLDDSAIFKALVTGDLITVERKGQNPFQVKNTARLLFSANEIPRSKDNTYSFFRRWTVLSFTASFPAGDPRRDENLLEKIITSEEMSGLLNVALEGYARLCYNRKFTESATTQKALEKYQIENDTVRQFIPDCCNIAEQAYTEKAKMYEAYKKYCLDGSFHPLSRQKFNSKLQEICPSVNESTHGVRTWRGIGLAI